MLEVINTVGSQLDNIEVNSYIVNLLSKGTIVNPANTEPNTQTPYSGKDSESIANFSPLGICKSFIRYAPKRSANKLKPLYVNSFHPHRVFMPKATFFWFVAVVFSNNENMLSYFILLSL